MKRPLSVILISLLMIVTGAVTTVFHGMEAMKDHPLGYDSILAILVSVLAVIAGVFMLRARNWARWLTLAWLAFHVILSAFHILREVIMHSLILAVIAFFLFRPAANRWFRGTKPA